MLLHRTRARYAVAAALIAVYALLTTVHTGEQTRWIVFANGCEIAAVLFAAYACARRARAERSTAAPEGVARSDRTRDFTRAWTLLSAAMASYGTGLVLLFIYEVVLGVRVPQPSAPDAFYMLCYALLVGGLLAFLRTPAGYRSHLRGVIDAMFISSGLLLCSWSLVIAPVLNGGDVTFGGLVNLSYPLLDALVLGVALFVGIRCRRNPLGGLGLLAGGMLAWAVADSLYWYENQVSANAPSVTPIETGWVAGFLLIAFAAMHRGRERERALSAEADQALLSLSALPAVAGVLITSAAWLLHGGVSAPAATVSIMGVVVLLGVARSAFTTREVNALTLDLEQRVADRTSALNGTERYYRALVQHSSDVVMVVDPEMVIRYASESAWDVLGYDPADLIGRDLSCFGDAALECLSNGIGRVLFEPDEVARVEWSLTDPAGRARRAESAISNLIGDPHVEAFVLNTRDDTDRAALEEELRTQAFHDALTGLPNRALLSDRAVQAFARAQRNGTSLAIIALDIDAFKLVNDGFGHRIGDELLCEVAERLNAHVRPQDTVARLGGDEFVVLMDAVESTESAIALAERLRESLHPEMRLDGQAHRITGSFGVAVGNAPHTDFDQLLSDADVALYAVKAAGKDAVRLYVPSMDQGISGRVKLQSELRKAIDEEELCLLYQPEFHTDDGRLQGFEALLRWQHPEHGLMSPDAFIPLAEESGLVIPIGRWVLREALRHAASWRDEDGHILPIAMAVNVSAVQLKAPSLISDVRTAIEASGIDSARVVLEVTESSFIDCSEPVISTLHALKGLGVRLAIDDFGTGYASVSNLQKMPIDIIKIDRSFIAAMSKEEHGTDLLEAIVGIGRALSLVTIAEGIETESQLQIARALGCDVAQGYLLGRPAPLASAERIIVQHTPALRAAAGLGPAGAILWRTVAAGH